jgi:hypothetical protein
MNWTASPRKRISTNVGIYRWQMEKKEDYFRVKDTIKTLKEEIVERQKSRKEPSQSMNYDKDEPYRGR